MTDWGSADPVIFIVGKLNEHFRLNLTLVDFDEKSPIELIQVLNDVFAELDNSLAGDVRDDPREQRAQRFLNLLNILKFKTPHPDQSDSSAPSPAWGGGGVYGGRKNERERERERERESESTARIVRSRDSSVESAQARGLRARPGDRREVGRVPRDARAGVFGLLVCF